MRPGGAGVRQRSAGPTAGPWVIETDGGIEAVFAAAPRAPVSIFAVGEGDDGAEARTPLAHDPPRSLAADLDLLKPSGAAPLRWERRGGGAKAKSGVNFAEGWRLADLDTAYLRTEGASESELVLRASDVFLAPGGSYRVSVLAAVHRCRAALIVDLTDARGEVVQVLERGVSPAARGGRDRAGYDLVEIAFEAPAKALGIRIRVRKGGSPAGQDSFLFVADPRLAPDGEAARSLGGADPKVRTEMAEAARGGAMLQVARVAGPTSLTPGQTLECQAPGCPPRRITLPASLGRRAEGLLPVSPHRAVTAWNRREDGVPRRIAAHRAWLRRGALGEPVPDLDGLLEWIESAAPAPRLEFPAAAAPDAAVVVQGDDPAVLLRTLAALRFANNRADLQVIVACGAATANAISRQVDNVEFVEDASDVVLAAARAQHVVLLPAGLEPVAGWIDELLAAFANFADVGVAGAKVISRDGLIEQAGGQVDPEGRTLWLGSGGGPRDPAFGYVRPVDVVSPLMATASVWRGVAQAGEPLDAGQICAAARRVGQTVLYVPTAEAWRLDDAAVSAWPLPAPDRNPPDRPTIPRVLFIDQEAPTVDMDAGGYASFQEMRLLQAAGCRVDFFPKNLAWMDRHTLALERAGVRCIYAPFARDFDGFLRRSAGDYAAIFVVRYKVARLVQEALQTLESRPRLILNLADLHFLREEREAAAGTPGFTAARAAETREAELAAIAAADLTLTYSPVEAEVIARHAAGAATIGRAPWTAEVRDAPAGAFASTDGLLFLGGFGHPPNAQAAVRFAKEVMPRLADALPGAVLRIVGSKATPEVLALAGPNVEVVGYVADLEAAFADARVFVAPLLAGAGLKGKVVEAMARGVPMVLTAIAAEATGLTHEVDCLIAETPQAQADAIIRLYTDEALWVRIANESLETARRQFGFDEAVQTMRAALQQVGVTPPMGPHLHYLHARPDRAQGASAAPAVLRQP